MSKPVVYHFWVLLLSDQERAPWECRSECVPKPNLVDGMRLDY